MSNSYPGLQGYDIVYSGRWSQTFLRNTQPPPLRLIGLWRIRQYFALKACNNLSDQNTNFQQCEQLKYHQHQHHHQQHHHQQHHHQQHHHQKHCRQNLTFCEVRPSMSYPMTFLLSHHHSHRVNVVEPAFGKGTSNTDCIPCSFQIISPTLLASLRPLHTVICTAVCVIRNFGGLILWGQV